MKKTVAGIAVAAFVATALVGCGDSSTSSSSSGSSSSGSGTATAQESITVAADTTFPPFESEQNGQVVGFDIDLINAIAKQENLKIDGGIKTMDFTGLIPSLQSDQVDVAVAGITIKKSREAAVNFSDPYYKSGLSILVKSDNTSVKSLDDLKNLTVATKKGTSTVDLLQKNGITKVQQFDNIDDAYNQLENGGAQAVVFDNPVNTNYMSSHKDVKVVGGLLTGEYYGIAISKDKSDLVAKFNDGLKKLWADGEYQNIYKKYFGDDQSGAVTSEMDPDKAALDDTKK